MLRYNFYDSDSENDRIGSVGATGDPVTTLGARHYTLRDQGFTFNLYSVSDSQWNSHSGFSYQRHRYRLEPQADVPNVLLAVLGAFSSGRNSVDELATTERRFHLYEHVATATHGHDVKFWRGVLALLRVKRATWYQPGHLFWIGLLFWVHSRAGPISGQPAANSS
jgi:hypothetical protein